MDFVSNQDDRLTKGKRTTRVGDIKYTAAMIGTYSVMILVRVSALVDHNLFECVPLCSDNTTLYLRDEQLFDEVDSRTVNRI